VIVITTLCCFTQVGHGNPLLFIMALHESRAYFEQNSLSIENSNAVFRQSSEYTCGPTALATLLHYYFGENTSEEDLAKVTHTFENLTTTLLSLRDAAREKGYEAIGYRMNLQQLRQQTDTSHIPVLIHFSEPTLHYSLVISVLDRNVLVSDPSEGNITMDTSDFIRRWDGKALVVSSHVHPANTTLIDHRKKSAITRLDTLNRTAASMLR